MHITPLQWRATDWIRQGKTYPRDFPWHIAEARSVTSVVLKIPWGLASGSIFPFFHARWKFRTKFRQMALGRILSG